MDSHTPDAESVKDEGDMFPQTDGTTLEQGSMVNPTTGRETPYEECWKDITPTAIAQEDDRVCVVLQVHHDCHEVRGLVVRLGQYCQGVLRVGETISVERWEWKKGGDGWKRQARIGDLWLPCGPAMNDSRLEKGGEARLGDFTWKVIEMEHF